MSTPFVQFNSACIRWPPCAPQGCALVRVILEVWLWTPALGPGRDLIPFLPVPQTLSYHYPSQPAL